MPVSGEARLPPLNAGETVSARVLSQGADGATKLAIGKATVELRLPVTVKAGETVQFKVTSGGAEPKLALLLDASGKPLPPQPSPQTPLAQTGQPRTSLPWRARSRPVSRHRSRPPPRAAR
ncbi:hypothetical protein D1F64_09745 [Breoghania sp. L-A4]|nr:hypothetical protein D1F64_09745 [Breoghania sp. L-A4]